jgi:opacity protein-like surface antigen
MKQILQLGILVVFSLVVASAAEAQRIEITPFVGYQFGGELDEIGDETITRKLDQGTTWGLMLDFGITDLDQVELYYSSQGTNLNRGVESAVAVTIDHFQIGALHHYAPNRPVNPYIGLTLGASRFEIGSDSDTRFSGAVAIGVKMVVSDHLGFRFDGRFFGISTGSGPITCSEELCIGYPDTSIIWQYAVNAGVIIHFGGK